MGKEMKSQGGWKVKRYSNKRESTFSPEIVKVTTSVRPLIKQVENKSDRYRNGKVYRI